MQVECRVILFTMPRRRRFKPRIDCVAILGKLSSFIVLWFTHKPNPYCLGLNSRLCRLCLHSSPNPSFDKGGMRGFASSIFISHPKPLPLIREGLVASVPLASCALGIMGILCKIDAITHKEQTFGSLKRRLPTLLYMSLLLMRESLTALCNRGKSCKSSAK